MEELSFTKPALDKFRQWHFWWLVVIAVVFLGSFLGLVRVGLSQNNSEPQNNIVFPSIKGQVSGTGTLFEIKDSDYLNITLKSSLPIEAAIQSAPKVVSVVIQSNPVSPVQLTFSGFTPNKTYYKYDNSFKNETIFNTDGTGSFSFIQDLSQGHHVWVQETKGTLFIPADCNSGVGIFNQTTHTCTLNQDLNTNIEITDNGITLDCSNHKLSDGFRWTSFAILLNNRQNVTVKNCTVNNATIGIAAIFSDNNTVTHNNANDNSVGILLSSSNGNTVSNTISTNNGQGIALNSFSQNNTVINNNLSDLLFGVTLNQSQSNTIKDNAIDGHSSTGIHITALSSSNQVLNNDISNSPFGIFILQSNGTSVIDSTIHDNQNGIAVGVLSFGTKVFHNNFINNTTQAQAFTASSFDNGLPNGGNFWNNYDTLAEGCHNLNNDNFCDAPFIFTGGQDNFPWTKQDGWKIKPIGQNAAQLAKELLNSAYLYGGKGWDFHNSEFVASNIVKSGYNFWNQSLPIPRVDFGTGVDCSGLIMWAYNRSFDPLKSRFNNFVKAEGADEQFRKNTEPITEAQLGPGDVMFFDFDHNNFIDHVTMFVGESGGFDVISAVDKDTGIVPRSKDILKKPENGFVAFKRVVSAFPPAVLITANSPVDLVVTDPDGFTITSETIIPSDLEFLHQIPGVFYYSEMEKGIDGRPIDQVYSYVAKAGDYIIKVIPEAGILPTETYTLVFSVSDQTITLAQDIFVSQIPANGYGVTISATGAISSFIPVTIDIKLGSDPNSINPRSKGVTPVAVLADQLFSAKDIVINSVTFAGASPQKGKLEDVDNDGDLDLMLHFNTRSLQLTPTSMEAVLTGKLTDGGLIKGKDSVRIVGIVSNPMFRTEVFLALFSGPTYFFQKIKIFLNELALIRSRIVNLVADYFGRLNPNNISKNEHISSMSPIFKIYRNEEWGFQFEYPEDWTFEINTFGGPNTKFNLQGNSSANDYNTLVPMFLINIVNPDFADRVINSRRKEGDIESDIAVGGILGKKFEYNEKYSEKFSIEKISIYLSIGEYQMILAVHKTYEDALARVLASFKFLK